METARRADNSEWSADSDVITADLAPLAQSAPQVSGGFSPALRYLLARIKPFYDEDLYGVLTARLVAPIARAAVQAPAPLQVTRLPRWEDADLFGRLQARRQHSAAIIALHDDDRFAPVRARRGVPSLEVLATWLKKAA
jgi:hypothetical protein